MRSQLTILHLSDFHFSDRRRWDADPVLRGLAQRIADDVSQGLVPARLGEGHRHQAPRRPGDADPAVGCLAGADADGSCASGIHNSPP